MLTAMKLSLIHMIEAGITLLERNFFVKNETSIRICYSVEKKIKYLYLPSVEEVAKFFAKHGLIKSYAIIDGVVKMYTTTLITISGNRGEPVQWEKPVHMRWEDIVMNASQVQWLCAYHEFELQNKVMGKVFDTLKIA